MRLQRQLSVNELLVTALRSPWKLVTLNMSEWDVLVRQARNANLLARIAGLVEDLKLTIHPGPRAHLESANAIAERQYAAVQWEAAKIARALADTGAPVIFLKGAAYVLAGLPVAQGRVFSDIDILVPKSLLPCVEAALMLHGWAGVEQDAYDNNYYRRWMHELPPMEHIKRGSVLDVHHAILPETSDRHPSSEKLIAASVPTESLGLRVLAPVDMLLHSATHLFDDGEWDHGLRDLVDLDGLLRHFGKDELFWKKLVPRAVELELARSLFYALRYVTRILHTSIPTEVIRAVDLVHGARPPDLLLMLMDALFLRALRPSHRTAQDALTPFARWLLYVRAHWLRMPPHLLIYHLLRKALKRAHVPKKQDEQALA